MGGKESCAKKQQSATDEDKMIVDEPEIIQSVNLGVRGCSLDKQKSKNVNCAKSVTDEECVILKNFGKGRPSKGNTNGSVTRIAPAKPLKKGFEKIIGEKKSEKVLTLSKIRSIVISAKIRVKENMKELSVIEETSIESLLEVEKNDSASNPSVSEKGNSEIGKETEAFDEVLKAGLYGSHLNMKMMKMIDERLKVIAKQLSLAKKDHVVGASPKKSSVSEQSAESCKRIGEAEIIVVSEKSNGKEKATLKSPDKVGVSLTKSMKHLRVNASGSNSLSDENKGNLNQPEHVVPKRGSASLPSSDGKNVIVAAPSMNCKPLAGKIKVVKSKEGDTSEHTAIVVSISNTNVELKSSNKEDASTTTSMKFPRVNPLTSDSSLSDADKERVEQSECTLGVGSDISLNVGAEDKVPAVKSKVRGKEDGTLSKSYWKVNALKRKRSIVFGKKAKVIHPLKRVKVEPDSSEYVESTLMQSKKLTCQSLSNVLSPSRVLRVNLGYRCDSSEFKKWSNGSISSRNCASLSTESSHLMKRIKTENESMNKENCKNVLSVKHKVVNREAEFNNQMNHSLVDRLSEVSSLGNTTEERLTDEECSGNERQRPIRRKFVKETVINNHKQTIIAKELKTERMERTMKMIKEEPIEIENSAVQIAHNSFLSPKKELGCTSNYSSIALDEVEVLKIIKPVFVFLGYRCDLKEPKAKLH